MRTTADLRAVVRRLTSMAIVLDIISDLDDLLQENERLKGLLHEVTCCGLSYQGKKHLELQLPKDLWKDIREVVK